MEEPAPMHAQWINYCYHYGVGSVFFLLAMSAMLRSGALKLDRPSDRFLVKGLVGGLLTFMTVHGLWILAAIP